MFPLNACSLLDRLGALWSRTFLFICPFLFVNPRALCSRLCSFGCVSQTKDSEAKKQEERAKRAAEAAADGKQAPEDGTLLSEIESSLEGADCRLCDSLLRQQQMTRRTVSCWWSSSSATRASRWSTTTFCATWWPRAGSTTRRLRPCSAPYSPAGPTQSRTLRSV